MNGYCCNDCARVQNIGAMPGNGGVGSASGLTSEEVVRDYKHFAIYMGLLTIVTFAGVWKWYQSD